MVTLHSEAIEEAVEILDGARSDVMRELPAGGPGPTYAYDGPHRSARLRLCWVEKPAPTRYGPNGAYVQWADLPAGTDSSVSRGGWVPQVYQPATILMHAIVRIAGGYGPVPCDCHRVEPEHHPVGCGCGSCSVQRIADEWDPRMGPK